MRLLRYGIQSAFAMVLGLCLPATVLAQGALVNGENHLGTIATVGELDEWTFTAAQGDTISISMAEVVQGTTSTSFNPYLRLRRPDGVQIGTDQGTLRATIDVTAPLSGTYTVVAASFTVATGNYLLTIANAPGTFVVPVGDEGGPMANGANHQGVIPLGDLDLWSFSAAKGDAISLSVGEVFPTETDPGFNPWIRLRGPDGKQLGSEQGTLRPTIDITAPLTGTYTVVVSSWTVPFTGNYLLTLAQSPGTFVVPPGDQGGPLINGENHPGIIHLGDLDQWSFVAAKGDAISISIGEIFTSEVDPGFNPWIRIRGPDGQQLDSEQGTLRPTIDVTAPLTGTYTVVVSSWTAAMGSYLLTLAKTPGSFVVPPGDQGGSITQNGVQYPGVIHLGDLDQWTFSATQGSNLVVSIGELFGGETDPGFNPWIRLRRPDGTSLGSDQGTLTAQINAVAPVTGLYTVVVASFTVPSDVGLYQLTVSGATVLPPPPTTVNDAHATTKGTPLVIAAPGVLANDTGTGPLTAVLVTTVSQGALGFAANGGLTYTPNANFVGTDSFTYQAANAGGVGNVATVTITVSEPTTPLPPTGLFAESISGNVVTLRWTPPQSGLPPTGYVLEGGGSPGQTIASMPTGSIVPRFSFGAPTGTFFVRIHTMSNTIKSGPSNEIKIDVNVPSVPPSAPTNLLGLVVNSNLSLAWRNTFAGGPPTSLILDVSGSISTSLPLGVTDSFSFAGVPGGTYTFSVRAQNAGGVSASSNPVTLTFPISCSGPPLPPDAFLADRVGNTIFVRWDPAATGVAPTGYVLNVSGSFNVSIPTPSRTLSGGVGPGSYNLSVIATNPCGASAPTAVQTVVVP